LEDIAASLRRGFGYKPEKGQPIGGEEDDATRFPSDPSTRCRSWQKPRRYGFVTRTPAQSSNSLMHFSDLGYFRKTLILLNSKRRARVSHDNLSTHLDHDARLSQKKHHASGSKANISVTPAFSAKPLQ
jgi:hypothetical protein